MPGFADSIVNFLERGGLQGALGMEPETQLKSGAIPIPMGALGQSAFQLLAAPFISEGGRFAGNKLGEFIEGDEEFQQFREENPELADTMLKLATAAPTALGGGLAAVRGLNRSAGGVVERGANQPGQARELMRKMKQSSTEDLIDDLIKMGESTAQQKTILQMKPSKVERGLEDFLRR